MTEEGTDDHTIGGADGGDWTVRESDGPETIERKLGHRERTRLERAARRHELGRPDVTELEIGSTTHRVAEVEPMDVDGVRTLTVGTIIWGVIAVALADGPVLVLGTVVETALAHRSSLPVGVVGAGTCWHAERR